MGKQLVRSRGQDPQKQTNSMEAMNAEQHANECRIGSLSENGKQRTTDELPERKTEIKKYGYGV